MIIMIASVFVSIAIGKRSKRKENVMRGNDWENDAIPVVPPRTGTRVPSRGSSRRTGVIVTMPPNPIVQNAFLLKQQLKVPVNTSTLVMKLTLEAASIMQFFTSYFVTATVPHVGCLLPPLPQLPPPLASGQMQVQVDHCQMRS